MLAVLGYIPHVRKPLQLQAVAQEVLRAVVVYLLPRAKALTDVHIIPQAVAVREFHNVVVIRVLQAVLQAVLVVPGMVILLDIRAREITLFQDFAELIQTNKGVKTAYIAVLGTLL